MTVFYNDTEPYVAEWLRNLTLIGEISSGDVCTDPIQELEGWQLAAYTRCHFFAGIGGWDYALKLAGWPDDLPVWTGSCPCQPFSVAGKRKGTSDERHLWPYFRNLIEQCRPSIVFGEQVASKDGRVWLAGVRADLEALGYAVGAADLCAAGVEAPHIRQRLYWMALTGRDERWRFLQHARESNGTKIRASIDTSGSSVISGLGNAEYDGSFSERKPRSTTTERRLLESQRSGESNIGLGDSERDGTQRTRREKYVLDAAGSSRKRLEHSASEQERFSRRAWESRSAVDCLDGKTRRVEPGVFPLANGVSNRVGKLRAYGNAIVPQVAAEFIKSAMEILNV